ncbi:MAG: hypothetical protein WBB69_06825 [Anaerolineales bacterium]
MSTKNILKDADRIVFSTFFGEGLVEITLAAFLVMFSVAPLLSARLGDFWSSAIFGPFWLIVFLILRFIRKNYVIPRMGTVKWGELRIKKLTTGGIVLLAINLIFFILGIFAGTTMLPLGLGSLIPVIFGTGIMILFFTGGYFFDYRYLYIYGVLIAIAFPIGEWLWQMNRASHHGFPIVFGVLSSLMFLTGVGKFLAFLRNTSLPSEEFIQ